MDQKEKIQRKTVQLLITAIRAELDCGTRHFDRAGRELKTVREILEVIISEGRVTIEPLAERVHIFENLSEKEPS